MIRFMIDTDQLAKLTGHAELLATYSDLVTDLPALRTKYPRSEIILIDRGLGDPTGHASVFDMEPGALDLEKVVAKYDDANRRGIKYLTVYHDRADTGAVAKAMGARRYYNWIATLDGTAHVQGYDPLHSPAIIQVLSAAELDYHADGSLVFEDSWHPTQAPLPSSGALTDLHTAMQAAAVTQNALTKLAAAVGG